MRVAVVLGCAAALSLGAAAVEARADDMTFRMGTYVWLPTIEGPLGLNPTGPPVLGDGSILDNLQFFGFGVAELSGDRFGALVDFAYVDIGFGDEVELPPQLPLKPDLDTKAMVGSLNGFYRVVDGDTWDVDLTAGVRGFWLETDFTLSGANTRRHRRQRRHQLVRRDHRRAGPGPVRQVGPDRPDRHRVGRRHHQLAGPGPG